MKRKSLEKLVQDLSEMFANNGQDAKLSIPKIKEIVNNKLSGIANCTNCYIIYNEQNIASYYDLLQKIQNKMQPEFTIEY
jgi:hypothetical protein